MSKNKTVEMKATDNLTEQLSDESIKKQISGWINQLSLEEKAALCSGMNVWTFKNIERLGIPGVVVSDGPHGLRREKFDENNTRYTVRATCFPTSSAMAASWNPELVYEARAAMAEECIAEEVDVLLGPGINMQRVPRCGRNFEYYSEDPYLAGQLGTGYVKGVQSKGVGTSLKHFAANNQEYERMTVDAVINERTLREIYLSAFETVIKKAQPWTVMSAYNRLNGDYASESKYLLTDILRDEWGFEGLVVSDWCAVHNRIKALHAGCDVEMPPVEDYRTDKEIVETVRSGKLDESVLDETVERILALVLKTEDRRKKGSGQPMNLEQHGVIAKKAADECITLLKNEDDILPLAKDKIKKLAVIGHHAKDPVIQGGGSAGVNPVKKECALEKINTSWRSSAADTKNNGSDMTVIYEEGVRPEIDLGSGMWEEIEKAFDGKNFIPYEEDKAAFAVKAAMEADAAIVFVGSPSYVETETLDRRNIKLPDHHMRQLAEIYKVQKNIITVVVSGAPIELGDVSRVSKAVVLNWLCGQAGGSALADVLFGIVNPSGKLPVTFPEKEADNPSYLTYPGEKGKACYAEGLFIGYRYYDKKEMVVQYPFGFGLSYTQFEYLNIESDQEDICFDDHENAKAGHEIIVKVTVKNTGKVKGKEIVQLYIADKESTVIKAAKELKGFDKIELSPGEAGTVEFRLDKRSFAYYDVDEKDWIAEKGEYDILVGKSSREICLTKTVSVV